MRSGKTHSALLEIEGRKERQTQGPGREEQVQPIWHVELESETYIQTQMAAGLSLSDPLLISLCLSLYLFHSPVCLLHVFPLLSSPSLVSFSSLRLCLSLLSPAHECSDGLLQLYLFKLQQNISFCRQGLCCENRAASPERRIISVSQRFTVTQLQALVHGSTV